MTLSIERDCKYNTASGPPKTIHDKNASSALIPFFKSVLQGACDSLIVPVSSDIKLNSILFDHSGIELVCLESSENLWAEESDYPLQQTIWNDILCALPAH